jgi:hypothetical protein
MPVCEQSHLEGMISILEGIQSRISGHHPRWVSEKIAPLFHAGSEKVWVTFWEAEIESFKEEPQKKE